MTVAEVKPYPLSIAAYRVLGEAGLIPENTELLYGQVYRKMSKSPLHSALVRYLARLIRAACPPEFFVDPEQPLSCADSEPEPDICVIRGKEEDFWHEHPCTAELVVEVCVTSHEYERMKLPAYAIAGVKECWLVFGVEKRIEVFSKPKDGRFSGHKTYNIADVLQSSQLPNLSVTLSHLFSR